MAMYTHTCVTCNITVLRLQIQPKIYIPYTSHTLLWPIRAHSGLSARKNIKGENAVEISTMYELKI